MEVSEHTFLVSFVVRVRAERAPFEDGKQRARFIVRRMVRSSLESIVDSHRDDEGLTFASDINLESFNLGQ